MHQVVLEVLSGKITKEEARRPDGIGGRSTVLNWMRQCAGIPYKSANCDLVPILQNMKEDSTKKVLEKKIKELEAKLKYAELKGRAYEIMVEIAKDKYNLDLEKKLVPNRSKTQGRATKSKPKGAL
jgi:hypothetical protein